MQTTTAGVVQHAPTGWIAMPDGSNLVRPVSSALLTLPNAITLARICAVPLAVWLVMREQFLPAFFLFVAAGVSDAVDGWLARRQGPSRLGTLLDPVADKALLVSMYVTLVGVRVLPDWIAILVVFRDLMIVGGVLVLTVLGQNVAIRPLPISKANTVLQIVLVAVALLLAGTGLSLPSLLIALIWAVAASTLASGTAYVWLAARAR
jgi:cardiolipin synthase